jgi:hypothetical protein
VSAIDGEATSAARRRAEAIAVLNTNDRGGYTVPTAGLYPFQWNWDSAFVAMGFAMFDADRALRELERLAEGQWRDGLIPHIVFHAPSDSYFPGPEVWDTRHTPPTSGIAQPPVLATALRFVAGKARSAQLGGTDARVQKLFGAALGWHRWWLQARDPDGTGLVAILHNWESGSDNSPAWDAALARVPTTPATVIRRQDTRHVDAEMRPRDENYQRYIYLVDTYRACGWDPAKQWAIAPFKIADVQTTAILARATEDLIALAPEFGAPDDEAELAAMRARLVAGLEKQWRPRLKRFVSRDLISGSDIEVPTQAGFVPIIALDLDDGRRSAIAGEIERWCENVAAGLPSVPRFSPDFEPKRYWRGPVWPPINWLLIDGLERNHLLGLADRLRKGTIKVIERAGFRENFDPVTGEGGGGDTFSWTAAAYLVLSGGESLSTRIPRPAPAKAGDGAASAGAASDPRCLPEIG